MNKNLKLIYTTWPDKSSALNAAKLLLEEKLIACANIIKDIESIYLWKGKLCQSHEIILILKTKESNKDKVLSKIRKIHPYEIPCIIFLDINGGNKDFLKWISET